MSKIKNAARALPENPSLENLKKQARALLNTLRTGDSDAEARVRNIHPRAATAGALDRARFTLSDAQLVVAREYGFESWPKLKAYVARQSSAANSRTEGAPSAEPSLAASDTTDLVDRLYQHLELMARRIEWVSRPELVRMRRASDLPGLIQAALAHCDASTKQALLELPDLRVRVSRLCAALEPLVRQRDPQPLGARDAEPFAPGDAAACLVVLHASRHPHLLGRCYALSEPTTKIGRHTDNQIMLHSDSVSRAHARIERTERTERTEPEFVLVDQGSTNGCFVNEAPEPVAECVLHDGDRLAIGDAVLGFLSGSELAVKYRAAVEYITWHDALTRSLNQKAWLAETERQIFYARGEEHALSALLLEIDQLADSKKRIGQLGGNALLLRVAQVLREELGESAKVGRYAEDLFGITLPGVDAAGALELAERLRRAVSARSLDLFGETLTVTVSVGVATLYRTTGADELVEDARAALGRAQEAGRNAVRGPREVAA